MDSHRTGGGDEKEGRARKDGGNASEQGGAAGLLHEISKPTAWRGGVQILVNEQEDARLLDRCEAKRKEWAKRWQCDEEVQNLEDKPWRNEELRSAEEALPRQKECHLDEVSRLYKAKTGVECDGFHAKVPLDLASETRGEMVEFLEKVAQSGKWPQQSLHDDVLLDSEECHERETDRADADVDTLVGSFESDGGDEVAAEVPR